MKSLLSLCAVASAIGVSVGFKNEVVPFDLPSCVSICPNKISPRNSRPVPNSQYNIVPLDVGSPDVCSIKCFEKGWVPFLVKATPVSVESDSMIWITIPDSREYSIMITSPRNIATLDREYYDYEREVITFSSFDSDVKMRDQEPKSKDANVALKALKDEVLSKIKNEEYLSEMEKLAGEKPFTVGGKQYQIKSRNTYSEEHIYAANYISQYLQSTKLDQVFFQPFKYAGIDTQNIIGVKRGTTRPNEIVVIGAHMDSTSPDRANAPGCVDNGSGSDAVMMAALAFANITTDRTIHFILFGAEEQGLVGSKYYVNNLQNNGYNVVSALIMDMIGYSSRYFGVKLETSSSAANINLVSKMESNVKSYGPNLTYVRSYNYFGSDHVPFIDSGIPCFLAIEQDDTNYPGYHKTTDKVSYLNVNQSVEITKAIVGTLFDLAFL